MNDTIRKVIFLLAMAWCLSTYLPPSWALVLGLIIMQFVGKPFEQLTHKHTTALLQISIVGLGFGLDAQNVIQAGRIGLIFTIISVLSVLTLGVLLGRWLGTDKKIAYLISLGTAICGGSAIAAVSPIIKADEKQISVALGTVFILNAAALLAFPTLGQWFGLSQWQFGLWSAVSIHDTSSVVGAASEYGTEALEVATAVKLLRTLWIIPVAILSAFLFKSESKGIKIPWFIGFFILAIISNTYLSWIESAYIVTGAKAGMSLVLFLIGAGLSRKELRSVGIRPFAQGIVIWLLVSVATLFVIVELIR